MDKRNLFRHAALLFGALLLLLNTPLAQTAQAQLSGLKGSIDKTSGSVHPALLDLHAGTQAAAKTAGDPTIESLLTVKDDMVLIDATASGRMNRLVRRLKRLGMQNISTYGRVCSGWLPISAIDNLDGLRDLRYAQPAAATNSGRLDPAMRDAIESAMLRYDDDDDDDDDGGGSGTDPRGITFSGGDPAMRSDLARDEFGVDGSGTTVGVLSDTYDDTFLALATDAADDIASGDLPAAGDINILDDTAGPGIDEGRAMMQLIHDVAPGAKQAFHTAFGGQADFASGIIELAEAGSDVIVDDVIYFAEPMYSDGIIAQAADSVNALGVPYFSSAGNGARQSYEDAYRPSGLFLFGSELHDFDPGAGTDVFQQVTFNSGSQVVFSFQWDQSFFSATGGAGATTDMDFCLLDDPVTTVLGCAIADNISSGDPVEVFGITGPGTFNFAILKFTGPDPGLIKYVYFSSSLDLNEYDTNSSSSYGHSNAAGAEAVGAARYTETPVFGVDPPLIEFFSAAGGTPILFEKDGTPLASPDVRLKPGVTGPDGGNTTFFFPFSTDLEGDGFPNFFGTSASAPHVAAVAALLIEQATDDDDDGYLAKGADDDDDDGGGGLSPEDIYDILRASTIDMDDPFTPGFDAGFDFGTGFGFVDACNALSDDDDGDACEDDDDDDGALYKHVADATDGEQTNKTTLLDNYPDPFNPETTIAFELADSRAVQLHIYDVVGRRIATLVNGVLPSGRHEVRWQASNLPSGMYFYQLVTDHLVQVRPMMLVK